MSNRIVITGIGVVSPIGISQKKFTESLQNGVSSADRISNDRINPEYCRLEDYPVQIACEVKNFDPLQFMSAKLARRYERSSHYALAAADQALRDANLINGPSLIEKCNPEKVSVLIGTSMGGIQTLESQTLKLKNYGSARVSPSTIPVSMSNQSAGRIAKRYGFSGNSASIVSACASSNSVFYHAFLDLSLGYHDIIIAGGTESIITPLSISAFSKLGALTKNFNHNPKAASRPFDRKRSGFVMGEGSGIVILETLKHAKNRDAKIYGELLSVSATTDTNQDMTKADQNGEQIARAMNLALTKSSLLPKDIDYINAHGTSTPSGDIIETRAIKSVFGKYAYKIPISSTKSMHGHCMGAGGLELIATLLSMEHMFIPPTINLEYKDPECDLDYVPNVARTTKIKTAMSNAFGFGGHNAVTIVKKLENLTTYSR